MQSTLTELAADSVRRRKAGDPAVEIASRWSEAVNSLLDVSLAATGSVGRGEATPLCQIDVLRTEPGSTPKLDRLRELGKIDDDGVSGESRGLPQDAATWRRAAAEWADRPRHNLAVMKIGLLADCSHDMRKAASDAVPGSRMIPEMLRNALSVMVPHLGTHRWSHSRVAVKEHLLTPVVKLARWGALASGCSELSTPQRLISVSRFALSQSEASELGEAFSVFLAAKLDLDLGLIDDTCTDHRGRLILPSLARSRASAIVAAAVAVRGVQKAAALRLSASGYAPGNSRGTDR